MKRFLIVAIACLAAPASAQEREVPYWASISADEAFMRAGPGDRYSINWVYERPGLPVKVIRYIQGWRFVEEPDGTQGWMYRGLLSDERTAIVTGEGLAAMREAGSPDAALRWNLEPGVVGTLGECVSGWCELDVDGHVGWVDADRLWGDGDP